MSEVTQTQPERPFAATPREELERQIMCPSVPKTEREWCAADEITRLRAEVAQNAIDLEEYRRDVERLRGLNAQYLAALKMWQEAVRVDAKMEGPVYMGVSSTLGRKAWEATLAAITGGNDADT